MSFYPAIQTRAQAELDAVLASQDRLPTLDDRASLPYLDGLLKELWRWNPSVPLGLAHRVAEDNLYRGMEIKEGTVIYANLWYVSCCLCLAASGPSQRWQGTSA